MKRDPGGIYRVSLMVGDTLAVVASFLLGLIARIFIDARPFYFEISVPDFALSVCLTVPFWLSILAALRLYSRTNLSRLSELLRLSAASLLGTMCMITMDFFLKINLFPVRMVAIYSTVICFVLLVCERALLRYLRGLVYRHGSGLIKVLVVGSNSNVTRIIRELSKPDRGYQLVAIVAPARFIPLEYRHLRQPSIKKSLSHPIDAVFHTDDLRTDYIYKQCVEHHLLYHFVPAEAALSQYMGHIHLVGNTPTISIRVTPLLAGKRVMKRTLDLILGSLLLLLAALPMGIIWCVSKILDPHGKPIYTQTRLSAFNSRVQIYKFRSMQTPYCGLSPEAAFRKLEREGLITSATTYAKHYRQNGDYLHDDPRLTPFGEFLRRTSLDELPQLINVIKGDISLVGPRALVPGELRHYGDRSLLLSVKAGLTGLAQVSGRRDLSFSERRALDLYYIQNWSIALDLEIILRTIAVVITGKGAR